MLSIRAAQRDRGDQLAHAGMAVNVDVDAIQSGADEGSVWCVSQVMRAQSQRLGHLAKSPRIRDISDHVVFRSILSTHKQTT
jgi:hypothetical protein